MVIAVYLMLLLMNTLMIAILFAIGRCELLRDILEVILFILFLIGVFGIIVIIMMSLFLIITS